MAKKNKTTALTPKQALALWKLVLVGDAPLLNAKFRPQLEAREVQGLVTAGLVTVTAGRGGKGRRISLTEKGWSWAERGFSASLSRSPAATPVLQALLAKVGTYLEVHGLALDDLLRPRQAEKASEASAPPDERIRDAYLRATGGRFNELVRLAALRALLPGEPSAEVDAALLGMQQRGRAVLYPVDDPQALGPEDATAALWITGARRDVVCIER
jgi:hypothetical protein